MSTDPAPTGVKTASGFGHQARDVTGGVAPAGSVTDAATHLYRILSPFTTQERHRIVRAALTLLGDDAVPAPAGSLVTPGVVASTDDGMSLPLSTQAQTWIRKQGVTLELLQNFFHFDKGEVTCIELAGSAKSNRERTICAYLFAGAASVLARGEAGFADELARGLCRHFGCYDQPNHAKYLKDVGNLLTGSKSVGWTVTAPGLARAASLLKGE